MRFLLDTRVVLRAPGRPAALPIRTRDLRADRADRLAVSADSTCGVAIERVPDRPDLRVDPNLIRREFIDIGYEDLSVTSSHAAAVASQPPIHQDSFDRLLIARATVEGITLLTADATVLRYPGPIQRV